MRRVFSVAIPGMLALAALMMVAPTAIAQRGGGGHGGGGGHVGGFSGGGHAGGFGGGFASHSFGGSYSGRASFSGRASYAPHGYSAAPRASYALPARSSIQAYRSGYRDRGRYRSPYRSPYRGYGYPYGVGNSWGVLPWDLGYPDFAGYGYDNDYVQPDMDASQQPVDSGQPLPDDDRPPYTDAPYGPAPYAASAPVSDEPALTLIFNDGHQQSIRNYALTSNYILVLDNAPSGREQRIPLTDLNVPATEKAAQQAGLEFTPPA
ncbi:MAG TPA: hypothetical protein VK819_16635 [Acidobacteriaceae bacterium]|nr:hypothetical protein [Acidobacteriaceae bacterium]